MLPKQTGAVLSLLSVAIALGVFLALLAGVANGSAAHLDARVNGPLSAANQHMVATVQAQRAVRATTAISFYLPLIHTPPLPLTQHRLSDPKDDVTSFQVSPDGKYVVYGAQAEDEYYDLFSVRLADGHLVSLNERPISVATLHAPEIVCCDPPGPPPSGIFDMQISPDGKFVVYRQDDGTSTIKRVSIGGGAPLNLSGDLGQNRMLTDLSISPDSKHILFGAFVENTAQEWLYSVAMDGGNVVDLGAQFPAGEVISPWSHIISPDSQSVLALGHRMQGDDYTQNLYRIPITGGTPIQLNPPLVSGGSVDYLIGPFVTPDSRNVIYRADQELDEIWELYTVPLAGGEVQKLNGPLPQSHYVGIAMLSPDGKWVLYEAGNYDTAGWNLYRVPISGGLSVNLTAQLPAAATNIDFGFTPDSRTILFLDGSSSLHIMPVDADPSDNSPAVGVVDGGWTISPDSQTIAFVNPTGLYVVPTTGGVARRCFDSTTQGPIAGFRFSSDSQFLAFAAGRSFPSTALYRADSTCSAVERLSLSSEGGGKYYGFNGADDFAFVTGSHAVIYRVQPVVDEIWQPSELYYVR